MMYRKNTLKNGLQIITSRMPHMESVSIGIWIGVGGRHENKRHCGIGHLIEHMLFKGTSRYSTSMLKEAIEGVGGSFNGFTTEETTCFLVKLPSAYLERGLDILSDMVLNPKFDPVELEKEKYVICEEIKMYLDQPSHHVFDILAETMWPNHALGRPIVGYINTVRNFRREDLIKFKERYYKPANISIIVCGKIKSSQNCRMFLKKVFSMHSTRKHFPYQSVRDAHRGSGIRIFYKDTKQTHLAFGFHGIPRTHKLRYALALLNIILGGNMSSRLFERLREKRALCYDISSNVKRYKETTIFLIHAGVDNKNTLNATAEIVHELTVLKQNFVTLNELNRAKEYAKGQMLLALEDTASRMLWLGDRIMQEGKAPSVKEVLKGIEKVTIHDIKTLANIIFTKRNMSFATIGPLEGMVRKQVKKALVL